MLTVTSGGFNYTFGAVVCILLYFCMTPWCWSQKGQNHVGK